MTDTALRQQAHTLIEAITPEQLTAVIGILRVLTPPSARGPASIPFEDELIGDEENAQVAAALASNQPGIPFEEVLAEYGLTLDELLQDKPQHTATEQLAKV